MPRRPGCRRVPRARPGGLTGATARTTRCSLQRFDPRRQGQPERHDLRLQHRDGHAVAVSPAASPLFDDGGVFAGSMALVIDVSELGGSISVDTAPGRGSTFHVYLPRGEASAPPQGPTPAQAADATAYRSVAPAHILCVDDDDVMRLAEEGVLRHEGHLVSSIARAADALEAVRTAPPGLRPGGGRLHNMPDLPGQPGLELARAPSAVRSDLPVSISTGYVTDELRSQAAALGVRELVRKENTVDELGRRWGGC